MSRHDALSDRWLEISVVLSSEFAEPVTHLFSRYGDGRVFVSQTGDWDADAGDTDSNPSDVVSVYGYLKMDASVDSRKGMIEVGLRLMSELTDMPPHSERIVSPEEWSNQTFPPIRVGDRIVITPWMRDDGIPEDPDDEDVHVYLSPGLAFGTGNHPTTRLCLQQILVDAGSDRLKGRRVLDVGCGSGILAIAALKLGASRAWCLDIDETAILAIRDNLVMSGVADRAHVLEGSMPNPDLPDFQFDYVFANITSRALIEISEPLVQSAKPGGVIFVSGILADQVEAVRDAFSNAGSVTIMDACQDGDWYMLRIAKSEQT